MDKQSKARRGAGQEPVWAEESIFGPGGGPEPEKVWQLYQKGMRFKEGIGLYDTVEVNENFFIGKQWEGVQANGLPTPVFNILKRDVAFVVSSITTDNLAVKATPLAATPDTGKLMEPARILNEEFESLLEHNSLVETIRAFTRDAAVRGDGCLYSYWDADVETGQEAKGAIRTEVLENTRVHFGNPNDRDVQSQPYIIVERRKEARLVRARARENGCEDWDSITPDMDNGHVQSDKLTDDKATCLLLLWKEDGEVWAYECTQKSEIRPAYRLGLRLYPIVWLCWDYVPDSYHGQAMITGLIPNQIFINRMWAMSMLSMMTTAYPKVIYDRNKIERWSNRVGEAIGVNGADINNVAKVMDPAVISPNVANFIQMAIEQTNQNLGATSAALGDVKPDNTSAIVALQRAAATPSEITKQNLRRCVEELARIYLEFIGEFYGKRTIDVEPTEEVRQAFEFAGQAVPGTVPQPFDFSQFKSLPMSLKIEVGASAYYSEIAAIQTLDNLLARGHISVTQYLKRLPDGYVPDRQGLIDEIERMQEAKQAPQTAQMGMKNEVKAPAASGAAQPNIMGAIMGALGN